MNKNLKKIFLLTCISAIFLCCKQEVKEISCETISLSQTNAHPFIDTLSWKLLVDGQSFWHFEALLSRDSSHVNTLVGYALCGYDFGRLQPIVKIKEVQGTPGTQISFSMNVDYWSETKKRIYSPVAFHSSDFNLIQGTMGHLTRTSFELIPKDEVTFPSEGFGSSFSASESVWLYIENGEVKVKDFEGTSDDFSEKIEQKLLRALKYSPFLAEEAKITFNYRLSKI